MPPSASAPVHAAVRPVSSPVAAVRPRGVDATFSNILAAFRGPSGRKEGRFAPGLPKAASRGTAALATRHAGPSPAAPAAADRRAQPKERDRPTEDDPRLDPMERRHAQLAPPGFAIAVAPPQAIEPAAPQPLAARAASSLETLLPALVKRIAWSGDAKRGTVRMELGAGELSGGTVLIHADAGEVSVHVSAPAGVDAAAWRDKIHRRLASRGLRVGSVEVD